jgi:hypothetical protein
MRSGDRSRRRGSDRQRPDHRRTALAGEAARIMQEHGVTDFRDAKAKAAERLGLGKSAPLPTNEEVAAALAERQRIFEGDTQPEVLEGLRHAALQAMRDLAEFHPRLTGDVLAGHATEHSGVELHLFSDTSELVGSALAALGLEHRAIDRRHRFRRDESEPFPGYEFIVDGCECVATVFPLRLRGQAPLSKIDGRPVRRIGERELAGILGVT